MAREPRPCLEAPPAPLRVELAADLASFIERWSALGDEPESAFQTAGWLRAWYATVGRRAGVTPLLLCVVEPASGRDLMLMPLISLRRHGLSFVEPADLGVTDYNAARYDAALAPDARLPGRLRQALRTALRGHDVLALHKMIERPAGRPDPLRDALDARPCEFFGNHIEIGDDWDAWRHSLDKTVRKEFERCWRVFQRSPQARFVRAERLDEALDLYHRLEAQQRARMRHLGSGYVLDGPAYSALYEQRLRDGLADGSALLTALMSGDELVAALYGLYDGRRYTMLRVCHAGEAWKHCAPGKLLLERTIHHLHQRGCRHFDFAIGDYFHKRVFRVGHAPLWDAQAALSWRGGLAGLAWRGKRALKRQPWLARLRSALTR